MQERRKFNNLTGLRGLAALWVVAHHLPMLPVLDGNYSAIASKGWLGVDLFFILSGFVISYVHQKDFQKINIEVIKNFAILRFARVYPVFFIVLLAWVAVVQVATLFSPDSIPGSMFTRNKFLYQLFLLNGWGIPNSNGWNGPSWSLSAEVFAYLCFPIIAFLTLRLEKIRNFLFVFFGIILVSVFLSYILNDMHQFMLDEKFTLFRVLSEFLLGVMVYNIFCRTEYPHFVSNFFALSALLIVLFLSIFAVQSRYDFCFLLAFSALIYFGAHATDGIANKVLGNNLMVYFGNISYSIYIVHSLILTVFSKAYKKSHLPLMHTPNSLISIGLVICALLTILLSAHILFYRVEKPMRKYIKNRLDYSVSSEESISEA